MTVLTLGVEDLKKSVQFYRDGLGFPTQGIVGEEYEGEGVAFFNLQNGMLLALWPRRSIAEDAGLPLHPPSATEFTIGYNVNRKEDVDRVMEEAKNAGATIVKNAAETFWGGYSGYFQDPDGHLWEAVWNPDLKVEE
jgi:uncharacterized protein